MYRAPAVCKALQRTRSWSSQLRQQLCDYTQSRDYTQTRNRENDQTVLNAYVKEKKESRSSVASLALVPVKVKAHGSDLIVKTYAFLDNWSNVSLCSEKLATQLGPSGRPTALTLTTIEREESESASQIVSLQVMDLEEENAVELPCVLTRLKLAVAVENGAGRCRSLASPC